MSEWSFQGKLVTGVIGICFMAILTSSVAMLESRVLITYMERVTAGPAPTGSTSVVHPETSRLPDADPARVKARRAEAALLVITIVTVVLLVSLCLLLMASLNRSYGQQIAARFKAEAGQTKAKEMILEMEASSHLKDEFLAMVSHELRSPLASILAWTHLLRSGALDLEKSRRALEVIERNVTSQAQLIDDLVDVSRVVAGKFRIDVKPVDLARVIKAAVDSQGPSSDAKQIRLQLVMDDRRDLVSGDSERLLQVMSNLISNAIKFTPSGGRVQVELQHADAHVQVSVEDTGIGIESEFLPHVFEPFRQASSRATRRHGGLGLGLSIVRHIVELHGGEIAVHSEGPNLGSRFTLKFPLLAAGDVEVPMRRNPIEGNRLGVVHSAGSNGVPPLVAEEEPSEGAFERVN